MMFDMRWYIHLIIYIYRQITVIINFCFICSIDVPSSPLINGPASVNLPPTPPGYSVPAPPPLPPCAPPPPPFQNAGASFAPPPPPMLPGFPGAPGMMDKCFL